MIRQKRRRAGGGGAAGPIAAGPRPAHLLLDHRVHRGLLGLRHGVKIRQAVHELLVPPPALLLAMGGVCELQGLLLRRHGEAGGCEELCLGRDEVLENTQGAAGLLGALDELRSG